VQVFFAVRESGITDAALQGGSAAGEMRSATLWSAETASPLLIQSGARVKAASRMPALQGGSAAGEMRRAMLWSAETASPLLIHPVRV
jgi:type IV secretory pathway VirB3-like protein